MDEINKVELAKMISMEHLSFNFGEKVGFVNYCQKALNSCAKRIPRNTLKRTLYKLYSKEKKRIASNIFKFRWTCINLFRYME